MPSDDGRGSSPHGSSPSRPGEPSPRGSSPSRPGLTLVAAYADNRVIGDHGRIPWRIADDFAHFKMTTMGGTLVMGRATYDSIGRALPGRTTVVVTRNPDWSAGGVLVAHALDEALALAARQPGQTYVVGGTSIYEQALPIATHQILTEVHQSPEGDAHYPEFDVGDWVETRREPRDGFEWVWWERPAGNRTTGGHVREA